MFKRIGKAINDGNIFAKIYKHMISAKHFFYIKDENIRREQQNLIIYEHLKKKFSYVLDKEIPIEERKRGDKIWTCWFQGMDNAPLLCQVGSSRMKQLFGEDNVVIITEENYKEYVDLPDYIIEKWKDGTISYTHFSDIIRYCLLYAYGGTWIDSTILILDNNYPSYFFDSELFLFADYISGTVPNIQSSFISAYSHSQLVGCVRELIFEYWKRENYTIDYNMYHMFFQMAEERYPIEWKKVYRFPNHCTHILRKYLFEPFDEKQYKQIKEMCPIQKLSHKKHVDGNISGSFYDVLINHGKEYLGIKDVS